MFFGESLPDRFHRLLQQDIPKADLLLVMGTSLQVAPVSHIPNMVSCNRVLFNRDLVMRVRKGKDIFVAGNCDANVQDLCSLLGWGEPLLQAHTEASLGESKKKGKWKDYEEYPGSEGSKTDGDREKRDSENKEGDIKEEEAES